MLTYPLSLSLSLSPLSVSLSLFLSADMLFTAAVALPAREEDWLESGLQGMMMLAFLAERLLVLAERLPVPAERLLVLAERLLEPALRLTLKA